MLGRRQRVVIALVTGGVMWLVFCAIWCFAVESNLFV